MFPVFTTFLRIHDSWDYLAPFRSRGWKASPDLTHDTTMCQLWKKVLLVVFSVLFNSYILDSSVHGAELQKASGFSRCSSEELKTSSFVLFSDERLLLRNSMHFLLIAKACTWCSREGANRPTGLVCQPPHLMWMICMQIQSVGSMVRWGFFFFFFLTYDSLMLSYLCGVWA